jgi:hypothetical protein
MILCQHCPSTKRCRNENKTEFSRLHVQVYNRVSWVSKYCHTQRYIHSSQNDVSSRKVKVCGVVSRGEVCVYCTKKILQEVGPINMPPNEGLSRLPVFGEMD